jgi:hypothetical protein
METFNFTGKPHKIPLMSYLRETPRFSDFQTDWPSKTDEPKQIKQKNAAESENRPKNIRM